MELIIKKLYAALVFFGLVASTTGAHDYDLVIMNGCVMDPESEFDAVRNVGIKDGRIAIITEEAISAADSIDASGHVVTAGFIDTHTHSSDNLRWPLVGTTIIARCPAAIRGRSLNIH